MSILNIGTRALQANQVALQTAGNNIANVNTAGYSRQRVILETVPGQFTGGGYIGKGVSVQTIQRNFDAFLTRQSTLASATQSADTARSNKLMQLQSIFSGGASGLGAAVSDMLNAFSDVASAPTDLTARTVVLTRVDETAARMRAASTSLDDLQAGVEQELSQKIDAINSLAKGIADVNGEIAKASGTGQPPNDLLDRRDQLIRDLNKYVQTSSIPSDDGTVGVFIGASQALVLGTTVAPVSLVKDDFGDQLKSKLAINRSGVQVVLDENTLGGGEVPGLMRFQNNDLLEARNLLGRLTLGITTAMNDQHKLGLDLDGNVGGNIFTPSSFNGLNVLEPAAPATLNAGGASLGLTIADPSQFAASDYELSFTSATAGNITRRSDGVVTLFDFATSVPPNTVTLDGITITDANPSTAVAGDRFLFKPFATSASNISSVFSTPRALAVASPVAGSMGAGNTGSLQQVALNARTNPPANVPLTLQFVNAGQYIRSDDAGYGNYGTAVLPQPVIYAYTSGQAIESNLPNNYPAQPPTYTAPLQNWSVTLQGTPKVGDTFTVQAMPAAYVKLNGGNASAMMDLRDVAMFDGAAMTDGYAGLISQVGIRTQSANYAASVSTTIAANLERDRASVSGVNLDEEAANLLQYQQAYQASAKVIQIAQSIFDTIIRQLGG